MAASLLVFLEKYLGQPNTGDNPVNRGQCVGLIEVWCDLNQHAHIGGNAKDLMTLANRAVYSVVPNGPLNFPPPGAIVCWDASWGGGFGHCAVALAATPMEIAVFEQNNPDGAAPRVGMHDYTGVQGWIVFK